MNHNMDLRPIYEAGKPLTAEQLENGQSYLESWQNFLNQKVSGWGIIEDLELTVTNENGTGSVVISKGFAITKKGEPIYLEKEVSSKFELKDQTLALVLLSKEYVKKDKIPNPANPLESTYLNELERISIETVPCQPSDLFVNANEMAEQNKIVLGTLKLIEGEWAVTNEIRHNGPITPSGGTSAFALRQAISESTRIQSAEARQRTSAILHQGKWKNILLGALLGTMLLALSIVAFRWWMSNPSQSQLLAHWSPAMPGLLEPGVADVLDLAVVASEEYEGERFRVAIKDVNGNPVGGTEVIFAIEGQQAKKAAVFIDANQGAESPITYQTSSKAVVRTDQNGYATPPRIRISPTLQDNSSLVITCQNVATINLKLSVVDAKYDEVAITSEYFLNYESKKILRTFPTEALALKLEIRRGGKLLATDLFESPVSCILTKTDAAAETKVEPVASNKEAPNPVKGFGIVTYKFPTLTAGDYTATVTYIDSENATKASSFSFKVE